MAGLRARYFVRFEARTLARCRAGKGRLRSVGLTTWLADGSNPSPSPRRLVKAPSRSTLSPWERAMLLRSALREPR
jgi:hypothetical protein